MTALDTELVATQLPTDVRGLFLYGQPSSGFPLGGGTLCISPFTPGIFRLFPALETSARGTARHALDYGSLPAGGAIAAGSTWVFQFWFRDRASGTGSDLTDAVLVTFCSG